MKLALAACSVATYSILPATHYVRSSEADLCTASYVPQRGLLAACVMHVASEHGINRLVL